jgi:hypothetical protein
MKMLDAGTALHRAVINREAKPSPHTTSVIELVAGLELRRLYTPASE